MLSTSRIAEIMFFCRQSFGSLLKKDFLLSVLLELDLYNCHFHPTLLD